MLYTDSDVSNYHIEVLILKIAKLKVIQTKQIHNGQSYCSCLVLQTSADNYLSAHKSIRRRLKAGGRIVDCRAYVLIMMKACARQIRFTSKLRYYCGISLS